MDFKFLKAVENDFQNVRQFYWDLTARMDQKTIGWKKGIYPSDEYILNSISEGNLYVLGIGSKYVGSVIINSSCNEGYEGVPWKVSCRPDKVLIPHALAVSPEYQGKGLGKYIVGEILKMAKNRGMEAVRLDILDGNTAAEKLYTGCGFTFVQAKNIFYEDTGWTVYKMYELKISV